MKGLILALVLIFANTAFADLETGVFEGTNKDGQTCQLKVVMKYYDLDVKHPLNERVMVELNGINWNLAHPPLVDAEAGKIVVDHNIFQQIAPMDVPGVMGSHALIMKIDHDKDPHPATEYTHIEHNYKDAAKSKSVTCQNLKKIADLVY